jgi:hypothetical protein
VAFQIIAKSVIALLLLFLAIQQSQAQDWEVIKTLDFENASDFSFPNVYNLGFIQGPHGATGVDTDKCALSQTFSSNKGFSTSVDLIAGDVYQSCCFMLISKLG